MRIPDFGRIAENGARLVDEVGGLLGRLQETNIRLGVTGLRRSGKTVFITSLIDNLLKEGRLPLFQPIAAERYQGARLRPQPDANVPRFDYEGHFANLAAARPRWPEATRGIHQIRVAMRIKPTSAVKRALRPVTTVNLDIIDYPGEWLLDLPLLTTGFEDWCRSILDAARQPPRLALAGPWLGWLDGVAPDGPADEGAAREGARLYAAYLQACRSSSAALSLLQPGRFVEPGDLAGAPMLTFCPLPPPTGRTRRETFFSLMEERFESYKSLVVRRFFNEHFGRLDRQIVLVDLLGALNAGPRALADMTGALTESLEAFRHGRGSLLDFLTGARIDKVLFAATKADHIASGQHGPLRQLLETLLGEARRKIRFEGAQVETMALAAVKCTRTVMTEHQGRQLLCVEGIPLGRDEPTVLFPGDLADDAEPFPAGVERPYNFLDFQPPPGIGRDGKGLANVRLDQVLNFVVGDYLS